MCLHILQVQSGILTEDSEGAGLSGPGASGWPTVKLVGAFYRSNAVVGSIASRNNILTVWPTFCVRFTQSFIG
jgi:hypothetical protein